MEGEPDKVEIIDLSGEDFKTYSIPCSISVLIVIIIGSINILMIFLFPGSYTSIFISIAVITGFIVYYCYFYSHNTGKIRKFTISNESIEIILPNISPFKINWSRFDKIEVRVRKLDFKPFYRYEFHFIYKESDINCNISLLDFHKEKLDQILLLLKEYAIRMKKEFNAFKETNVSGVILVENLNL